MPTIPDKMRKINEFEDVRVLTQKDIYNKVGKRAPKMPKSGGIALFGLSKVTSIANGENLVVSSLDEETRLNERATQEAIEKAKSEASAVKQQETPSVEK